jgi:hypothetical protein
MNPKRYITEIRMNHTSLVKFLFDTDCTSLLRYRVDDTRFNARMQSNSTLSRAEFNTAILVLFYELRTHFMYEYSGGGRDFSHPSWHLLLEKVCFSLCWKNDFCFSLISLIFSDQFRKWFPRAVCIEDICNRPKLKTKWECHMYAIRDTTYFCSLFEPHLRA